MSVRYDLDQELGDDEYEYDYDDGYDDGEYVYEGPDFGPFDVARLDPEMTDALARMDFGAVQVPIPPTGTVAVEPTNKGRLQAVHVTMPGGRLSLSALAAPRSTGLWKDLCAEIESSLKEAGAVVRSATGDWGRELLATTDKASSVFVGIDGDRWMVYGVASGPSAEQPLLDAELRRMLRGTIVVRGASPYPPRTVLPLEMPSALAGDEAAEVAPQKATLTLRTRSVTPADEAPEEHPRVAEAPAPAPRAVPEVPAERTRALGGPVPEPTQALPVVRPRPQPSGGFRAEPPARPYGPPGAVPAAAWGGQGGQYGPPAPQAPFGPPPGVPADGGPATEFVNGGPVPGGTGRHPAGPVRDERTGHPADGGRPSGGRPAPAGPGAWGQGVPPANGGPANGAPNGSGWPGPVSGVPGSPNGAPVNGAAAHGATPYGVPNGSPTDASAARGAAPYGAAPDGLPAQGAPLPGPAPYGAPANGSPYGAPADGTAGLPVTGAPLGAQPGPWGGQPAETGAFEVPSTGRSVPRPGTPAPAATGSAPAGPLDGTRRPDPAGDVPTAAWPGGPQAAGSGSHRLPAEAAAERPGTAPSAWPTSGEPSGRPADTPSRHRRADTGVTSTVRPADTALGSTGVPSGRRHADGPVATGSGPAESRGLTGPTGTGGHLPAGGANGHRTPGAAGTPVGAPGAPAGTGGMPAGAPGTPADPAASGTPGADLGVPAAADLPAAPWTGTVPAAAGDPWADGPSGGLPAPSPWAEVAPEPGYETVDRGAGRMPSYGYVDAEASAESAPVLLPGSPDDLPSSLFDALMAESAERRETGTRAPAGGRRRRPEPEDAPPVTEFGDDLEDGEARHAGGPGTQPALAYLGLDPMTLFAPAKPGKHRRPT